MANAPKGTKRSRPSVRPLAWARRSFAPASIWGHRLRSASLRPPLDVFDFVERRCAPIPQMNTSTQPSEGAGRSRSKAAGELTLGLLSGEKRKRTRIPCGSEPAREGGLTADQSLPAEHPISVGASLLAMVMCHRALMLPDPPLSRTGSLPQGICGGSYRRAHPQKEHTHPIFPDLRPALSNQVPAHEHRWFFIRAGSP